MTTRPISDDEVYRELEAIKFRLQAHATDEAMTRESLWLLRNELRDLADTIPRRDKPQHR